MSSFQWTFDEEELGGVLGYDGGGEGLIESWGDDPDTFEDLIVNLQDSDDGFDGLSSFGSLENRETESLRDDPLSQDLAVSSTSCSFDSDGDLGDTLPQLVSAMRLSGDVSEEEELSEFVGYDGGGEGLMESWGDDPDTFEDLIADLQDSDDGFDADDDGEFPSTVTTVTAMTRSSASQETESLHDDPLPQDLAVSSSSPSRSFDSDGDLGDTLPQLVSTMRLSGNVSEEEEELSEFLIYDGGGEGLTESWFDDPDTFWGLIADLPDSAVGFDFGSPILVDTNDTDSDDFEFRVLTGHVGEAAAGITTRPFHASRTVVDSLPEATFSEEEASRGCAVCKDCFASGQLAALLPCKHFFHGDCIWPWLAIRNTCPVCRHQLRMDDPEYQQRMARRVIVLVPLQHQEAPAQTGGDRATMGATECVAENGPEQSSS
ncbi:hypothetical protein ABZP36_032051 [Zizania latifolia]